jgi:Ca2+-binding EF-hand superfamily protein
MGACASSPPEDPTVSALDLALAARLKTYIATHPDVHAAKSLHKVALNFGGMLKSFEALRVVFARADADSNGTIEYHEFLSACLELQMTKGQNQELLKEVYATADVNGDGLVDFREFAMALTLAFLIVAVKGDCVTADDSTTDVRAPDDGFGLGNGTTETETRRLTHAALDKVLEAWLVFDTDGSGFIQKANVQSRARDVRGSENGRQPRARGFLKTNLLSVRGDELRSTRPDFVPGVSVRGGGVVRTGG